MIENLSSSYLGKVELKRAVQIGIVVEDLEQTTRLLGSLFGLGPFQFIEWPDSPDSKYYYRGTEQHIKNRLAFLQVGTFELELIQLLEGDRNGFRDFLKQKGGGIHHILFEVDDIDAVIKTLSKDGISVLQSGTGIRPGTRWALLDTQDLVGFFIELRHLVPGCDGTSIPNDKTGEQA
jgi:catechol 2,3-dioxygenase-like lactoylglutathione lyase family enzyme